MRRVLDRLHEVDVTVGNQIDGHLQQMDVRLGGSAVAETRRPVVGEGEIVDMPEGAPV